MNSPYFSSLSRRGMLWMMVAACLQPATAQSLASTGGPKLASVQRLRTSSQQGQSLAGVLQQIKSRYNIYFLYQNRHVEGKYVYGEVPYDQPIQVLLENILKPNELRFEQIKPDTYSIFSSKKKKKAADDRSGQSRLDGSRLMVEATPAGNDNAAIAGEKSALIDALAITVSGRVTDEAGTGMPGVTVVEKGTTNGTTTDANGGYRINVAGEASVLVYSFVGYITEEAVVGSRTQIDTRLVADIKSLGEVVVIGYGTRERKDLTGAIGTIKADKIAALPIASPDQALQGRISGVQITTTSGDPGARQVVRIRGVGTTGNNDPLYVIDGIPVGETRDGNLLSGQNPLALINPNDIESIDVLKDASASAIYGLRASNGVILITTKRGKAGKVVANFSARTGIQQIPKFVDNLDTPGYTSLIKEIYANGNETPKLATDFPGDLLTRTETTDWQRALYNSNAPINDYNLSVSGGSENANFSVSGGYFRQESIIKQRALERYSMSVNSDFKAGKIFRFGESLRLAYSKADNSGTGSFGDGARMPPIQRIYNANNATGFEFANFTTGGAGRSQNFLARNSLQEQDEHTLRMLGGIYAEVEPIKGLRIRGNIQGDYSLRRNLGFAFNDTDYFGSVTQKNTYGDRNLQTFNFLKELLVYFDRSFGQHNISLLGGATSQRFDLWGMGASASNLPFTGLEQRFFASAPEADQGRAENFRNYWALQGYIGRASYNYNSRYYLDATVRRDGSSRFAPENRWGVFPSVAAAWRISGESFMQNIPYLSDLKLRLGWGQLGNQDTQDFAFLSTVNLNQQYFFNGVRVRGAALGGFANRELGWETSTTTNIGLDAGLLDNRITLTAEYFIKNTDNILIGVPLPRASGFENTTINAVSVQNKGLELALGYNGTAGTDFKYSISGNVTFQKNKVTGLGEKGEPFTVGNNRTELGMPVGYFYGYQTDGIFQSQADINAYKATIQDNISNAVAPGDIRFRDINGPKPENSPRGVYFSGSPDGKVDANDRTYLGKAIPDAFYGLDMTGSYKGIDLSVFFQGVAGVQLYNGVRNTGESMSGAANQWATTANRWTATNPSNTMPRAVINDLNQNNRFSDRWVEDAGFLRLKNVQLGYNLPQGILKRLGGAVANLRIYAAATNLLTFTKYTGIDPEFASGNVLENGNDFGGVPPVRVFTTGLNVTF